MLKLSFQIFIPYLLFTVIPCAVLHAFKPNKKSLEAAFKALFRGIELSRLKEVDKSDSFGFNAAFKV